MNSEQLILNTAKETLLIESVAIHSLKDSLGHMFVQFVHLLNDMKGRVIFTGIGKSSIVAQKIVATLNSTGTTANFMHASDAVHGDLGMLNKEDVLVCISKSGETSEFKILLPLAKEMVSHCVSITSNEESYLALHSDLHIHIPIDKEAEPNNLAPTASTTAQMALGDALAASLLALKGFTPNDFSRFHPSGSLGNRLYLKVEDLMKENQCPQVQMGDSLKEVILSITSGMLGATVVVDEDDKPLGVITDGDLRRMLANSQEDFHFSAQDIMSHNPKLVSADSFAVEALEIIRENSITQVVVVNNDKYKGMIHLHDLVRKGII